MRRLSEEEGKLIRLSAEIVTRANQDEAKLFYAAVGEGISRWAAMEEMLVHILAKLLKTPINKAGLVGYSTSFYGLVQVIDDLFVVDGTYAKSMKMWRRTVSTLRRENDVRVQLAHQSLHRNGLEVAVVGFAKAYLRPSPLDTRSKSRKSTALDEEGIREFISRVNALHQRLKEILAQMKKRRVSR